MHLYIQRRVMTMTTMMNKSPGRLPRVKRLGGEGWMAGVRLPDTTVADDHDLDILTHVFCKERPRDARAAVVAVGEKVAPRQERRRRRRRKYHNEERASEEWRDRRRWRIATINRTRARLRARGRERRDERGLARPHTHTHRSAEGGDVRAAERAQLQATEHAPPSE